MHAQQTERLSVQDAAAQLGTVTGKLVRILRRRGPAEVGPGSLSALATLARCGPMRLGDLAAREGVAPPTLTRMVAALEEAGLVAREPDVQDRRAVLVSATPAGLQVVEQALTDRARLLTARLALLPPDQLAALIAALPALEALAADDPH